VATLTDVAKAYCKANGHTFVGPVGTGAFKETFQIALASGQSQALKVFQPGFSVERTSREISAMQRCSHPNIARLTSIATFYFDGLQYFLSAEEFLAGGTLASRLDRGLLSQTAAIDLGKRLADAIAHIASRELVHRDIKPDNILFRADGDSPVIVDFGLVRDLVKTSLTQTWLIRGPGTPYFASPEQLRNEKALIDWRSDQFSLGVVLALCIFGAHPFDEGDDSPTQVVERVATRCPQGKNFLARAGNAGLSILAKMTDPWPVNRFRLPEPFLKAWREVSE
jgi:serine/threonine protein kinase